MKKEKLLVWDFDGVIADSEILWCKNWQDHLNRIGCDISFEESVKYLAGVGMTDKVRVLKEKFDIDLPDGVEDAVYKDSVRDMKTKMKMIDGVEQCLNLTQYNHCLATGGSYEKTDIKIDVLKLHKYFNKDNIFSSESVKIGKPEPDLFLLAAEKIGYKPKDCIVIEDSTHGVEAAIRAGMNVIVFTGATHTNNDKYRQKIKDMGVENIFSNMNDVYKFLKSSV